MALRPDGTTSFQDLQNVLNTGGTEALTYFVFDVAYIDGYDIRHAALSDRKTLLEGLFSSGALGGGRVRYGDHVRGRGGAFFENACRYKLEGVVSKAAVSRYSGRRTRDWLKVRCGERQEFVIGGYTDPGGARTGFGALLTGLHTENGLKYTGRVGTGFNERLLASMYETLKKLEQDRPPFVNPPTGAEAKGVHWMRPELVAEVSFTGWTDEGIIRHASFQGLREDKPPSDVVPGRPAAAVTRKKGHVMIAGVKLTNPGRVLYETTGVTKADLARYYLSVSGLMLPHLSGRPLTLVRCPDGSHGDCFYQKHANPTVPRAVKRVEITEDGEPATGLMVDDAQGLVSLAQMGTLEVHAWGSRIDKVEYPDKIVFDIDPDPSVGWDEVVGTAFLLKERLSGLGLESFVKTTGGKGLHIVAPIVPEKDWEAVKAFTKAVAEDIAREHPGRFTSKMTKARRMGKIFIDYMRNMRGATAVEAYSTRSRPGAPVSAPVTWEELASGNIRSDSFNAGNMGERLLKDPWDGFLLIRQKLPSP